jgi:hypothetical protein
MLALITLAAVGAGQYFGIDRFFCGMCSVCFPAAKQPNATITSIPAAPAAAGQRTGVMS